MAASRLDPQSRLTVEPGTVVGSPASSPAIRATLRLSSPAPLALPRTISSTCAGVEVGRAVDEGADDQRGQVVGTLAGERAAVAAERRPDRVVHEDVVGHRHRPNGRLRRVMRTGEGRGTPAIYGSVEGRRHGL